MSEFTELYRRQESDWCKVKFDGGELFIAQQHPNGKRESILLFEDEVAKLVKILEPHPTRDWRADRT